MDKIEFEKKLALYDKTYFHGVTPLITDEQYDKLVTEYEHLYGKYKPNSIQGLDESIHVKCILPVRSPSLDKIKTQKQLGLYIKNHPGPYVYSVKVDGMAIIIEYKYNSTKIMTHSTDGIHGSDISHLYDYFNI